ncbi:hypothetical protein V494_01381 [Pseudogymnoascus sp. VKM F-4513 (FW-928)]|nr:hypothetical protein V494_01381 [Pseudogymnoascus sp. VKM F-4513 (FW-928)]
MVPYHLSATLPRLPWATSPRPSLTPSVASSTLHLSLTASPSSPTTSSTSTSTSSYAPASPIEPDIDHTLLTRPASSSPSLPSSSLRQRRASLPTLARSLSSAASLGRAISVIGRANAGRRSSAPTPGGGRSRTPTTMGGGSGSLENSFTSAAGAGMAMPEEDEGGDDARREREEEEEDDGGMEIGCWAKQVELNQISPSSSSSSSSADEDRSSSALGSASGATTPPSPLSQSFSVGDFDVLTPTMPPSPPSPLSPLSQSHTPYDFGDYKIVAATGGGGGAGMGMGMRGGMREMERRWSGSTAHEEDVLVAPEPECGGGGVTTAASMNATGRSSSGSDSGSGSARSSYGAGDTRRHGRIMMSGLGVGVGALGALLDGVVEERVFFEIEDFPRANRGSGSQGQGQGQGVVVGGVAM